MATVALQPKQVAVKKLVWESRRTWIGLWGGRGCAKSFALDAIGIEHLIENPGEVGCIVMRNFDQVFKFHIEPIIRAWPESEPYIKRTMPASFKIPVGRGRFSQLDFSYGEDLATIERRFRSGNYDWIAIDQAEQFMEDELREIRKACRKGPAKMILSFNMGGAGIQTLRKWFHTHEVNENEDPEDFGGVHFYPWDNVVWSLDALKQDGLTQDDYYAWTDEQRMRYCATRSTYGKILNSENEAIRKRDWFGSWDSLEGAYFGAVFDLKALRITNNQVRELIKPWDDRWIATDWGKAHFCANYWAASTKCAPSDVERILGWEVDKPLTIHVIYREMIVNEMASPEVGRELVARTPVPERERIRKYYLSPDAFGERDSPNTIADNLDAALTPYGMARSEQADNDPDGGAMLLYQLLEAAKLRGKGQPEVLLISSECPELLSALPSLMRDPKNIDRVLKTDKGRAVVEQDVYDAARYLLKSKLSPGVKPKRVLLDEKLAAQTSGMARLQTLLTFEKDWRKKHASIQRVRRFQ